MHTPFTRFTALLLTFSLVPLFGVAQTPTPNTDPIEVPTNDEIRDEILEKYGNQVPNEAEAISGVIENNISLDISPKYPQPGQEVTVRLQGNITDLTRATASWYINDTLEQQGIDRRSLTFTAGSLGSVHKIDIYLTTEEGYDVHKQTTIYPISIDLAWESTSYTPPFYKGKALPSPETQLKIVALPDIRLTNGTQISPGALFYTWKVDGDILDTVSGRGKDILYVDAPRPYQTLDIEVMVSSQGRTYTGTAATEIVSSDPEVVLYTQNPLEGVFYNNALAGGNPIEIGSETSLRAEPYFFSQEGIQYTWSMNNEPIEGAGRDVVFENRDEVSGIAQIEVAVRNLIHTFQTANTAVRMQFGDNAVQDNVFAQ